MIDRFSMRRLCGANGFLRSASISAIAGGLLLPASALAQANADDIAQPGDGEAIVVTGSRIKQVQLQAPIPVTSVGREQIAQSGRENIAKVLNNLPQMGVGLSDANSQGRGTSQGLNLVNLRRLGTNRTLVLVNGRRVVPGQPLTSSVDLNTLPSVLIDRVDISLGGASAVYGADAVSGVVNLILKKNYEGFTARVNGGITSRGDGESWGATLTGGKNFAEGRGNITLNAVYDQVKGVEAVDRKYASNGYNYIRNPNGTTPLFIQVPGIRFNGLNDPGAFFIGNKGYTFSDDGLSYRPYDFGSVGNRSGRSIGGDGGFYEKYDNLSLPTKRYVFTGMLNYEFSRAAKFFVEANYSRTNVLGFWQPPEEDVQYAAAFISVDNPYMLPALRNALLDAGQDGIQVFRNNNDFGRRGSDSDRDVYQFTAGFDGDLGGGWSYNAYASYGRSINNIKLLNGRLQDRFLESIDVVMGPNGPQCASVTARAQGCLPLNIMGLDTGDPAAIAYSSYDDRYRKTAGLIDLGASITGDLFMLPGGPVSLAAGVEYRRDTARTFPSAQLQANNTFYPQEAPISGKVEVREAFGELRVPLLKGIPLVHDLALQGAFRVSDYSTNGMHWSWNAGGTYEPFEGLRLRGMRSLAVRAPNIGELFSPVTSGFSFDQDPCDVSVIGLSPNRAANCAALGIPAGFDAPTNGKTILGRYGGNPDLDPETARTWTYGIVLTPPRIPGLSISVDYFDIDIRNAIGNIPTQTILNNCVDQDIPVAQNPNCAAVTRDPVTNAVTSISAVQLNIGRLMTKGVDFNIRYVLPLETLSARLPGQLDLSLVGTYLHRLRYFSDANNPQSETRRDGVIGNPDWEMLWTATYSVPKFSFTWQARSISSQWIDYFTGITSETYDKPYTGSKVYHDWSIGYDLNDAFNLRVNVNNVFDNKPPMRGINIHQGINNASIYPNLGTSFSGAITYKF